MGISVQSGKTLFGFVPEVVSDGDETDGFDISQFLKTFGEHVDVLKIISRLIEETDIDNNGNDGAAVALPPPLSKNETKMRTREDIEKEASKKGAKGG